jgi:TPR repeat protein
MQKLLLFLALTSCGGHKDAAVPSSSGSTTSAAPSASPAPADAAGPSTDAALWLPGDKNVPREAANDSPKMCTEAAACTSLCDAGDGPGCYWLGVMHATRSDIDMGVPYDPQKALSLFLQSCDFGVTLGCNGAAQIFRVGSMGIASDIPRAQRLFQKACDLGMTGAPCEYAKSLKK